MEILFNVQPTLPSKNKIVPDLCEHDCTQQSIREHPFSCRKNIIIQIIDKGKATYQGQAKKIEG
jgi:hypothetical protein